MPIYQFKNKETGEVVEKNLRISELDDWKKDNPAFESYFSSAPGLVSDSQTPLRRAGTEWRNHLDAIKKRSGRTNTIKT